MYLFLGHIKTIIITYQDETIGQMLHLITDKKLLDQIFLRRVEYANRTAKQNSASPIPKDLQVIPVKWGDKSDCFEDTTAISLW